MLTSLHAGKVEKLSMIVAGPSHVSRLRFAYESGEVAPPVSSIEWLDRPGESITSPFFRNSSVFNEPIPTLLFVTGFRLGNRRLVDPGKPGSYSGIDKSIISRSRDAALYDETIELLDNTVKRNPDIKLIFWSLAGREFNNRISGKYMTNASYKHPAWNLEIVESRYSDNIASMFPVIKHEMASVLFRDNSVHPSWVGNELITRIVDTDRSPAELFSEIIRTQSFPVLSFENRTIIVGQSVFINRLKLMIESGIISVSNVEFSSVREILSDPDDFGSNFDVVFVSGVRDSADDPRQQLARQVDMLQRVGRLRRGNSSMVFWEAHAAAAKGQSALLTPPVFESAADGRACVINIDRRHVDFRTLDPTMEGAKDVLLDLGAKLTWRRFEAGSGLAVGDGVPGGI